MPRVRSILGCADSTNLRQAVCLLVLYTLVLLFYLKLSASSRRSRTVHQPAKQASTFSDALMALRRWLWQELSFNYLFGR